MPVQPWESGWLGQWRRVATTRRHAEVHEARRVGEVFKSSFGKVFATVWRERRLHHFVL